MSVRGLEFIFFGWLIGIEMAFGHGSVFADGHVNGTSRLIGLGITALWLIIVGSFISARRNQ